MRCRNLQWHVDYMNPIVSRKLSSLDCIITVGLSAMLTHYSFHDVSDTLMCVSAEVPADIAKYLPESLLAKPEQSLVDISTTVSLIPEPSKDNEQSSPICPRPLKHRRITPTALPASPPQSLQKQLIVS